MNKYQGHGAIGSAVILSLPSRCRVSEVLEELTRKPMAKPRACPESAETFSTSFS